VNARLRQAALGALLGLLACGAASGQGTGAGGLSGAPAAQGMFKPGPSAKEKFSIEDKTIFEGQDQDHADKAAAAAMERASEAPGTRLPSSAKDAAAWSNPHTTGNVPVVDIHDRKRMIEDYARQLQQASKKPYVLGQPAKVETQSADTRSAAVIKAMQLQKYTIDDAARAPRKMDVPREWGLAPPTIGRPRAPCPQCQEVDPGPAGVVLEEVYHFPKAGPREHTALGLARQDPAACGQAIGQMRTADRTGYSRVDDDGFLQQCLAVPARGVAGSLDAARQPAVDACFKLYAQFDEKCLETKASKRDEDLLQHAGILVRVVPGLPMKILCSAWRVSNSSVLSARHCLAEENLRASSQKTVAAGALTFLPYSQARAVRFDPARRRFGYVVAGEIGKNGAVVPLSYPSTKPPIAEDMVLLKVEAADADMAGATEGSRPAVAIPRRSQHGSFITVIGFQEFVYRAYLLSARLKNQALPTDESLVASGEWRKFVRVHRSSVCRSLVSEPDSLSHYCQTYGRTSGAPIFAFDDSTPGKALTYLVGVQSRGQERGEASRPNNEAVALHQGSHPYLERVLGLGGP